MEPVAEITQFPSVVLRLSERSTTDADARHLSVFDSYVRPTLNPRLTRFSTELTGITQETVDAAPAIDEVLTKYERWLRDLGLVNDEGDRVGNWCHVTWGDVDIMTTLRNELRHKGLALPTFFGSWINLKDGAVFKRHYGRDPSGGLRACVESVLGPGSWEGRAHNGLVDSVNTAKIVRHMVRTGFRFVRSTRGLDGNGVPFGLGTRRSPDPRRR